MTVFGQRNNYQWSVEFNDLGQVIGAGAHLVDREQVGDTCYDTPQDALRAAVDYLVAREGAA